MFFLFLIQEMNHRKKYWQMLWSRNSFLDILTCGSEQFVTVSRSDFHPVTLFIHYSPTQGFYTLFDNICFVFNGVCWSAKQPFNKSKTGKKPLGVPQHYFRQKCRMYHTWFDCKYNVRNNGVHNKNKHSGKQRSTVLLFVNTDTLEVKEEVLYTRKHVVVFMFTTWIWHNLI